MVPESRVWFFIICTSQVWHRCISKTGSDCCEFLCILKFWISAFKFSFSVTSSGLAAQSQFHEKFLIALSLDWRRVLTKVYLTLSFKSFWSLKVLEIRWVYSSKSILNTHARRKLKSTEMTKTKLLWQDINVDTSRNNCKSFLTNCFKFLKMKWTWKTFWRRKWSCCVLFFKSTCLAKICGPYM